MKKLYIGCDHAGFLAKDIAIKAFVDASFDVVDLGVFDTQSVDYPDIAKKVCKEVLAQNAMGCLICGTGIGMSISANRFKGIRAALCKDAQTASLAKEHNNANVLCLGARTSTNDEIVTIIHAFCNADFLGDRHQRRVEKIDDISC